jgi:hypothetical protein
MISSSSGVVAMLTACRLSCSGCADCRKRRVGADLLPEVLLRDARCGLANLFQPLKCLVTAQLLWRPYCATQCVDFVQALGK